MNNNLLKQFLITAKKRGYAGGGENVAMQEADGSKSTRYEERDFLFHDNWFGGEPFGGREVVWKDKKPLWMMVYYGSDSGKAPGLIPFLMKTLSHLPEEFPARGPKLFEEGNFRYENKWEGNLSEFWGMEKIFYNGQEVYWAKYQGGLIDQRKDQ